MKKAIAIPYRLAIAFIIFVQLSNQTIMNAITHNYNAITINQQSQDGYINLNQMAEASGKRIDNWLRLDSTKELFAEFDRQQSDLTSSDLSLTTSDLRKLNSDLVHFEVERSLNSSNDQPALITYEGKSGGTWAHPHIAIQFAQWCSAAFALQVSRWVCDWIATNKTPEMSKERLQLETVKINAANKLAIAQINVGAKIEIERMKLEAKQKTSRSYVHIPPASEDGDNWYQQIADYVSDKSEVKSVAIAKWLGIEKPDSGYTLKRITSILRGLGFKDVHTQAGKVWRKQSLI
jgi:hypothetical protein